MNKLEAVNQILRETGHPEVPALDSTGGSLAGRIERHLDAVERRIQASGWHYNTREHIELTPDAITNKIAVPTGTLQITGDRDQYARWRTVSTSGQSAEANVTQIGTFMFDNANNTYEFENGIEAFRVVLRFDFECIPPAVREYIVAVAATRYCESFMDNPRKCMYLKQRELDAHALAYRFNQEAADINALDTAENRRVRGVSVYMNNGGYPSGW